MKERPILFNAEMVNAVLSGRKTQTRRIMKVQPESTEFESRFIIDSTKRSEIGKWCWAEPGVFINPRRSELFSSPFGAVGDRLWVRERTRVDLLLKNRRAHVRYEANGEYRIVPVPERIKSMVEGRCMSNGCYREASRITLEITGIRVERLNGISEEDAAAEGVGSAVWFAAKGLPEEEWTSLSEHGAHQASHINNFATLWESIYGEESWQANPWVWVVEFKRVEIES